MGSRDHSITCETCGMQRGGLNDYKCRCDETPLRLVKYAKKREVTCATQWTGEMMPAVMELIGQRKVHVDNNQLILGNGWFARVGDWIMSTSGEDLTVIGDEVFRRIYEEVDDAGRAVPPTDDAHDAAIANFVRELDVLLLAGLKLSREDHPSIFNERSRLARSLGRLLEDEAYTAAREERHRIRDKIAKELTP